MDKTFFSKLISIESILAQAYVVILIGMALPYGIPLFFPIVFFYFLISFIRRSMRGDLSFNANLGFILFYLCVFAYLAGMVSNDGILYRDNVRDIKNIIGLLVLSFLLSEMEAEKFPKFIELFSRLAVIALSITAILSVTNFLGAVTGSTIGLFTFYRGKEYIGASLGGEYNMFALGMFAGLFAACYRFYKSNKILVKCLYLIVIALFILNIVLAGSRRGWVVLALFIIYLCVKMSFRITQWAVLYFRKLKVDTIKAIISIMLALMMGIFIFTSVIGRFEVKRTIEIKKLTNRFDTVFSDTSKISSAFEQRTLRWKFAADLIQSFSLKELILGSGFSYLMDYGLEFKSDTGEDTPHNIFISSFLYSGILGGVLFIGLIILSVIFVFRYRRIYGEFFILLFITTLMFITPTTNSFFSVRILPIIILTIFSVFPLFFWNISRNNDCLT